MQLACNNCGHLVYAVGFHLFEFAFKFPSVFGGHLTRGNIPSRKEEGRYTSYYLQDQAILCILPL
jgi:hypothetical protein